MTPRYQASSSPTEDALRRFHLWAHLPDELWSKLYAAMRWQTVAAKQEITLCANDSRCLCVLWSGQASVYAKAADASHGALLRTMDAGTVFGVHCVFSHETPPFSRVVANKPCRVLLIPAEVFEAALLSHGETMAGYVRFLTQRVDFLNQKIQYLTSGSAEQRLAAYLLRIIPDDQPQQLAHSATALADLLNIGRASLYRAIRQLTDDGFLVREGRKYRLMHRDALIQTLSGAKPDEPEQI